MNGTQPITEDQFQRFKRLIYDEAGINLAPEKKSLVEARLAKRLKHFNLSTYGQYFKLLNTPDYPTEFQMMVDLLTTNETYFFREPKHFEFLSREVLQTWKRGPLRVWSAACSSGEEVYTLAMLLSDRMGAKLWDIVGSDISTQMLERCEQGLYPMSRAEHMSQYYLQKFCLKGTGKFEGMLLVDSKLRQRCEFHKVNLTNPLPTLGRFDVIFLRNVMIYFDVEVKKQVVSRLLKVLNPGGYLFISHSESLHGINHELQMIRPSIYRKME